jgi:muconolactone D-isomerase
MPSADDLDRTIMDRLLLREFLEFEAIWPVRPFKNFLEDCPRILERRR